MRPTPATTIAAGILPAAPLAMSVDTDRPAYRYGGNGRFLPANGAAWREVERWNAYADLWNKRTANRRTAP